MLCGQVDKVVQLYEMMMTGHCVVWTGGQSGPVVRNDDDTALHDDRWAHRWWQVCRAQHAVPGTD